MTMGFLRAMKSTYFFVERHFEGERDCMFALIKIEFDVFEDVSFKLK